MGDQFYCFDTLGYQSEHPSNPTNDIIIPIKLHNQKQSFCGLELIAVELNAAQNLVEEDRNQIYLSHGFSEGFGCTFTVGTDQVTLPSQSILISGVVQGSNTVFTSSEPHQLHLAWPSPVRLLPSGTLLEAESLVIIDELTFQVPGDLTPDTILYHSTIPNNFALAALITTELTTCNLTFDICTGRFCLRCICDEPVDFCVTPDSLAFKMGYGVGLHPFESPVYKDCKVTLERQTIYSRPQGQCIAALDPGDYRRPEDFINELGAQLNRFNFTTDQTLLIQDPLSNSITTLTVPAGLYTAATLADALSGILSVTYAEPSFILSADEPFNILGGTLVPILGLPEVVLEGSNTYTSIKRVCPGDGYMYNLSMCGDQLVIACQRPPPLDTNFEAAAPPIQGLVAVNDGSDIYYSIASPDTYEPPIPIADGTPVVIASQEPCNFTLQLAPRKGSHSIHSLLGFQAKDYDSKGNVLVAPGSMDLNSRNYVMLQVMDINGSTCIQHCLGYTNFIGKLTLLINPVRVLDRFFPMALKFYSPTVITKLRLRLLNPDGSLYQLNGQDWSGTLRLIA